MTATASFSCPDARLVPFMELATSLPWVATGFGFDEDGDHYAFVSLQHGDGQGELLLSTAPNGLVLLDCRTWEKVGGPFVDGQEAAHCARKVLTNLNPTEGDAT